MYFSAIDSAFVFWKERNIVKTKKQPVCQINAAKSGIRAVKGYIRKKRIVEGTVCIPANLIVDLLIWTLVSGGCFINHGCGWLPFVPSFWQASNQSKVYKSRIFSLVLPIAAEVWYFSPSTLCSIYVTGSLRKSSSTWVNEEAEEKQNKTGTSPRHVNSMFGAEDHEQNHK